jgi:hypothetical protein
MKQLEWSRYSFLIVFVLLIMLFNLSLPIALISMAGDGEAFATLGDLIIELFRVAPSCMILIILMIVAWYALRLFRVHLSKTEFLPTDYLESFQKLHEEGELTGEEFRLVRRLISLQPPRGSQEPKRDYSLLNQSSPPLPADRPSGKITKN